MYKNKLLIILILFNITFFSCKIEVNKEKDILKFDISEIKKPCDCINYSVRIATTISEKNFDVDIFNKKGISIDSLNYNAEFLKTAMEKLNSTNKFCRNKFDIYELQDCIENNTIIKKNSKSDYAILIKKMYQKVPLFTVD